MSGHLADTEHSTLSVGIAVAEASFEPRRHGIVQPRLVFYTSTDAAAAAAAAALNVTTRCLSTINRQRVRRAVSSSFFFGAHLFCHGRRARRLRGPTLT